MSSYSLLEVELEAHKIRLILLQQHLEEPTRTMIRYLFDALCKGHVFGSFDFNLRKGVRDLLIYPDLF